jgi:hypothetical protein
VGAAGPKLTDMLGGRKELPTGLAGGSVIIPLIVCIMVGVSDGVADKRRAFEDGAGLGDGVATVTEPLADALLLLLLRHLPAAQKPPTTAPPTSSELSNSATTMTVIQN